MDDLTLALAALGGIGILGVVAYNSWQVRKAGPKRADPTPSGRVEGHEPGFSDGLDLGGGPAAAPGSPGDPLAAGRSCGHAGPQ